MESALAGTSTELAAVPEGEGIAEETINPTHAAIAADIHEDLAELLAAHQSVRKADEQALAAREQERTRAKEEAEASDHRRANTPKKKMMAPKRRLAKCKVTSTDLERPLENEAVNRDAFTRPRYRE